MEEVEYLRYVRLPLQTYRKVSCASRNQSWGPACPALEFPPGPSWFDKALLSNINQTWASFREPTWLKFRQNSRQTSDYSDSSWPNKDLFEVSKVGKSLFDVFLEKTFYLYEMAEVWSRLKVEEKSPITIRVWEVQNIAKSISSLNASTCFIHTFWTMRDKFPTHFLGCYLGVVFYLYHYPFSQILTLSLHM